MHENKKAYFLLLPALFIIAVLFIQGLAAGFIESIKTPQGLFSLDAYTSIFTKTHIRESLFLTFKIGILTTIGALFLGLLIIYFLYMINLMSISKFLQRLSQGPMIIPYIAAGYLFVLLLGEQGWISAVMAQMGFIKSHNNWPSIIQNGSGTGIIITYIWKASPFVVMMLFPIILRVDEGWISMGRILGATRSRAFFILVMPLLIPTILICGLLIFAYFFSAFEIPYLLGVTHPRHLAVEAFELYSKGTTAQRPEAFALGILIFAVTAFSGLLVIKSIDHFNKKTKGGW